MRLIIELLDKKSMASTDQFGNFFHSTNAAQTRQNIDHIYPISNSDTLSESEQPMLSCADRQADQG